jgi:hypothetical protein
MVERIENDYQKFLRSQNDLKKFVRMFFELVFCCPKVRPRQISPNDP